MSLASLMNQPVTVRRMTVTGSKDRYGNPTPQMLSDAPTVGYLEQTAAVEVVADRDTVVSDWLLILPPGTLIEATDRAVVGGNVYEVVGAPLRAYNPRTKSEHHVEARLRRVVG